MWVVIAKCQGPVAKMRGQGTLNLLVVGSNLPQRIFFSRLISAFSFFRDAFLNRFIASDRKAQVRIWVGFVFSFRR